MPDTVDINIGDTGPGMAADVPRELVVPLQTIADAASSMAAMNKRMGAPAAGGGMESAFLRDALRQLGGARGGAAGIRGGPAAAAGGIPSFLKRLGLGVAGAVGGGITSSFFQEIKQSTDILSRIMLADRLGIPRQGVIAGTPLPSRFLTQRGIQAQQPKFFTQARKGIAVLKRGITGSLDVAEKLIKSFLEETSGTASFIRGIVNPRGTGGMGFWERLKVEAARMFLKGSAPLPASIFTPGVSNEEIEEKKRTEERRKAIEQERIPAPGPGFEIDYGDQEPRRQRTTSQPAGEPLSSIRTQDHYAEWMNQPALEVTPVILPTHWPSVELYIT